MDNLKKWTFMKGSKNWKTGTNQVRNGTQITKAGTQAEEGSKRLKNRHE